MNKFNADDLGSFTHLLFFKVEYYRSIRYCVKWKGSMCPQRSNRQPRASKKNTKTSPAPEEEVIQRQLRGRRRRGKGSTGDSLCIAGEGTGCDILDIITTQEEKHVGEEDGGKAVEIADKELDDLDEDRVSVCSSTASGPSFYHSTYRKARPSQNLCLACQKLYQKAKKIKTPIINKLLDNDPMSPTCDQWVLIKKRTSQRWPNARGKLLSHIKKIKKACEKQSEQRVEESAACSRPHTFLHRNLRRCVKAKKERKKNKNRRKRQRDGSQGTRVAKQQRLHTNTPIKMTCVEPNSRRKSSSQGNRGVTAEAIPSSVTQEATTPSKRTPKQTGRFRNLLAELRSKSSMIVRETH